MPSPFNRILLAIEGTEFDAGAERVGIALAADCKVPLMGVLPLVSNTEYEIMAPELEQKDEAEAAGKIRKLKETARAQGVELQGNVRLGEEPYQEVVDEAKEKQADLIVLRRRGKHSFLANLFLGEMVHTVTGHAPCDVLIVPRAAQMWSKGIVLATDYSPHSERATEVAASLAVHYKLPLTIVSVAEQKDGNQTDTGAAKDKLEQALVKVRAAGAQADGRLVEGVKPGQAILKVAEEANADLVVMGRRGLNRVERILVGSTSEWVASHAACSVLIIQQNAPASDN